MKKKGFTLVELLAVIVILAVIAVIAVPIIIGIIKDAKYKAAVESLKGYLDAAEKIITLNELKEEEDFPEADNNGCYNLKDLDKKIEVKGNRPTGIKDSDKMCFKDGNVKDMDKVIIDGYEAEVKDYKLYVGNKEVKEETSSSSSTMPTINDYVKNGLLAQYDGYDEPYTDNGNKYWGDSSGNTNNGLMIGFDSTSGWQNNSMNFDGVDDAIDIGLANYNFGQNVTFEAVVRVNSTKTYAQEFFGNWEGGGGGLFCNTSNNLSMSFLFKEINAYRGVAFSANIGTWYVLDGTYDGTTLKLYSNGELKSSLAVSGTIKETSVSIALGANPGKNSYENYSNISIARAALYNRALTETEINTNYNISKTRFSL